MCEAPKPVQKLVDVVDQEPAARVWACERCTFLHDGQAAHRPTCSMCQAAKPQAIDSELEACFRPYSTLSSPALSDVPEHWITFDQDISAHPSKERRRSISDESLSLRQQLKEQQEQLQELMHLLKQASLTSTCTPAPMAMLSPASTHIPRRIDGNKHPPAPTTGAYQCSDNELPAWLAAAAEQLDMLHGLDDTVTTSPLTQMDAASVAPSKPSPALEAAVQRAQEQLASWAESESRHRQGQQMQLTGCGDDKMVADAEVLNRARHAWAALDVEARAALSREQTQR